MADVEDVKEEVVAAADTAAEDVTKLAEEVEVELKYAHTTANVVIGGLNRDLKFGPGLVSVPKEIAEDLLRRDKEYAQYDENRHAGQVVTINAGNIDAQGR